MRAIENPNQNQNQKMNKNMMCCYGCCMCMPIMVYSCIPHYLIS